jgi:hypothetical protein
MNKNIFTSIILILLIVLSLVELDKTIEKSKENKRLQGQLEMYKEQMLKGYCIDGTEYLYSEKYSKGIEVIKFVKCEDL